MGVSLVDVTFKWEPIEKIKALSAAQLAALGWVLVRKREGSDFRLGCYRFVEHDKVWVNERGDMLDWFPQDFRLIER